MPQSFVTRLARLLLPALLVSALPALAAAQGGRITGTVRDTEARPLSGATVSISWPDRYLA